MLPTNYKPAIIIAEVGCTHIGKMDRAKYLIDLAKQSGAHVVKFQKRNPKECVPKHLWNKPHPNEIFSYGKTYLEHRINIELNLEQHKELKDYCETIGIEYSSSVWDMTSAKEIISLRPKFIKIPSACNMNTSLINFIKDSYNGEIHISLGMLSPLEVFKVFNYFEDIRDRVVIYHCTSIYPCPFEKLYLKEISNILLSWNRVGFSNHGYGIAADVAAYILGATYIERHFTNDRSFRHTDSAASLEPTGLSKLCRDLKAVHAALKNKPNELSQEEEKEKNKLRNV